MHVALHVAHCGAIILAIRALSDTFYPNGTPANLSHEAANYSYSHY